jgi:hypothetical protein
MNDRILPGFFQISIINVNFRSKAPRLGAFKKIGQMSYPQIGLDAVKLLLLPPYRRDNILIGKGGSC